MTTSLVRRKLTCEQAKPSSESNLTTNVELDLISQEMINHDLGEAATTTAPGDGPGSGHQPTRQTNPVEVEKKRPRPAPRPQPLPRRPGPANTLGPQLGGAAGIPDLSKHGGISGATSGTSGTITGTEALGDPLLPHPRSYDDTSNVELLPQFIQGWYLLVDANLDANERNLVMTALGGNFDPLRVAQELRNQFSESDVRRRDGARRFQSYIGDTLDDDDLAEHHLDETTEDILTEGMSEEGIALVVDAEEVAQEAMAALHQAKRTLKEARQRQHQVRQNRKYFQGANHSGRGSSSATSSRPRDDSQIECLRCGVKGHRVAQCPHKPLKETQGQGNLADTSSADKQQAPFVCYTNSVAGYVSETEQPAALSASPVSEGLKTAEAVKLGMAVVDGGATQTIGSATAIEAVMKGNAAKRGSSGLRGIDTRDPPVFSFGNSTENRCLSTAKLQVYAGGTPGEMTIHTLEDGESPILMSIDTLRKVGALIDFQADLAVFRNIDPSRILKLERSRTGHQLLPLTEDWMSNSVAAQEAVPSLTSFVKH